MTTKEKQSLRLVFNKIDEARTKLGIARIAGSINDTAREVAALDRIDKLLFEAVVDMERIHVV